MTISDPGRGLVRRLGVTAAALFAFAAASHQRAEALSLASPGSAPSARFATDDLTTEVRHGGHGGGGGFRGGGGGGFRGGGGGRRSDIRLKHDIVLLGHLPNGLGYYRFSYKGS